MRHADRPDLGFTRPLDQESRDHLRLRRQWVIQPRHEASERPWPRIDLGRSLVLHHHRELAVQQAVLDDRRVVVLGVAIATASQRRPLDVRLRHVVEGRETVTTLLHELCGTYVLIDSTPDHVAVYGDPAGMMSVFYGRERVSSTPTLIGPLVRDRALDAEYPFRGDNDWYPGSLTPYEGVRALLPNHALDAASHTIARFWPTEEPKRLDPYTGRRHLAELLQDLVEAAVARGPVLCSVTGGRD